MNTFSFKNKALYAESVAVTDLMVEYGSPIYIYSRGQIESNWQQFDQAFGDHPHLICYAVKANSNLGVLNVLAKLGSAFLYSSKALLILTPNLFSFRPVAI